MLAFCNNSKFIELIPYSHNCIYYGFAVLDLGLTPTPALSDSGRLLEAKS